MGCDPIRALESIIAQPVFGTRREWDDHPHSWDHHRMAGFDAKNLKMVLCHRLCRHLRSDDLRLSAGRDAGWIAAFARDLPAFFWILAPMGISILWKRWKPTDVRFALTENQVLLGIGILAAVISAYVLVSDRLADTVNQSNLWRQYQLVEAFLDEESAGDDQPVLVNNPPAYYASTGRPALMIPYGDETTIQDLAYQFSASYLLLDGSHISQLDDLYQNPTKPKGRISLYR